MRVAPRKRLPIHSTDLRIRLRNPATGRLDASPIAALLGISLYDIARLCDVSTESISQNPSSSGIQAKLQLLEGVTYALRWCDGSEAKFRAWLSCPNRDFPEMNGQKLSPLDLILQGHVELVAQKVHNLRAGHPS